MQQLMSLEEVEKIMDETADAAEYQRQISDLVSGGLSDQDESEVSVTTARRSPPPPGRTAPCYSVMTFYLGSR